MTRMIKLDRTYRVQVVETRDFYIKIQASSPSDAILKGAYLIDNNWESELRDAGFELDKSTIDREVTNAVAIDTSQEK